MIEVSVAAMRLVLSGMMERHPKLKVVMSHTGGALPYQSGRMDKNTPKAKLPKPASTYLKRMYTDTVSPHAAGMKFAIEYYGIDNVMYGTDYPCWEPAQALKLIDELKLSPQDKQKLFYDNARRILGLRDPAPAKAARASRRWRSNAPPHHFRCTNHSRSTRSSASCPVGSAASSTVRPASSSSGAHSSCLSVAMPFQPPIAPWISQPMAVPS